MTVKQRAGRILRILRKEYPEAETALIFHNPWQLLVATILSAQCTDARVNSITPALFRDYPEPGDYLGMKKDTLVAYIRSAGFYNNKARSILGAAGTVMRTFGGKVPASMEEMLKIPGVARKTANIVLSYGMGIVEGIAVDTHVKRLSFRMGMTVSVRPERIEKDLMELFPKNDWPLINTVLIQHGRQICGARRPRCGECPAATLCPKKGL